MKYHYAIIKSREMTVLGLLLHSTDFPLRRQLRHPANNPIQSTPSPLHHPLSPLTCPPPPPPSRRHLHSRYPLINPHQLLLPRFIQRRPRRPRSLSPRKILSRPYVFFQAWRRQVNERVGAALCGAGGVGAGEFGGDPAGVNGVTCGCGTPVAGDVVGEHYTRVERFRGASGFDRRGRFGNVHGGRVWMIGLRRHVG